MNEYPILHTRVKQSPHEVRHLLILSVDGSRVQNLIQLICGNPTEIATGTEYEMEQKAGALMQVRNPVEGERDSVLKTNTIPL